MTKQLSTIKKHVMTDLRKIVKNNLSTTEDNSQHSSSSESRTYFKLPSLNGDQQIWLGQSIIALIGVNRSGSYSPEIEKSCLVDMFQKYQISHQEN